jgi:hypothetical protein
MLKYLKSPLLKQLLGNLLTSLPVEVFAKIGNSRHPTPIFKERLYCELSVGFCFVFTKSIFLKGNNRIDSMEA